MTAYFGIAAIAWCLAWLSKSHSSPNSHAWRLDRRTGDPVRVLEHLRWNRYDFLLVLILVAFSGLRDGVGTDYRTYVSLFNAIDPDDFVGSLHASPVEAGYTGLSFLVRQFSDDPHAIFWVASSLTVVAFYAAIKYASRDLPFSVLLYLMLAFYVAPFNAMRQGIGVALVFLGIVLVRSPVARTLLFVAAGFFHYTAWVAAILFLIVELWRPSVRKAAIAIAVLLGLELSVVIVNLIDPTLLVEALTAVNPRYSSYFLEQTGVGAYLVILSRVALLVIAWILLINARGGPALGWQRYRIWLIFAAIETCLLLIGTQAVVISRMALYFSAIWVVLIPNLLWDVSRRSEPRLRSRLQRALVGGVSNSRVIKPAAVVFGGVYLSFYITHYSGLLPYQTYLGF